jgi:hypothetical protein
MDIRSLVTRKRVMCLSARRGRVPVAVVERPKNEDRLESIARARRRHMKSHVRAMRGGTEKWPLISVLV